MRTVILKISNQKVAFSDTVEVILSNTNLRTDHMRFKESRPIFWEAEMVSFEKEAQKLVVKVVDYAPQNITNFTAQSPKFPINVVEFLPLNWPELEGQLSTYQKKHLTEMIVDEALPKTKLHTIQIPARIPMKKLEFELGYVSFTKSYKWNKEDGIFRISFPDSIPEYNYIKPYFTKILGKATVDVVIEVASSSTETKVAGVKSIDLEKINSESIRILKVQKLEEWSSKKPKYAPPDQEVFSFEEAMESYGDQALGNIDVLEKDLLFHLLEKEDVRNRLQLQYLSEKIHSDKEKLLMTLVPQFGFVFVNFGAEMTHFVWELLNSHATYVWSSPLKEVEDVLRLVENEIRTINVHGRTQYKSMFENSENLFFNALIHRSSRYSYEQYFARWKKNLDNLLI